MAFVTITRGTGGNQRVRAAIAQANTGQTDWLSVPEWANGCVVQLNMTATAGTTPGPTLMHIRSLVPNLQAVGTTNAGKADDTGAMTLLTATGGLANTGQYQCAIGPGITGIADVVNSTQNSLNTVLPPILGVQLVLDRTDTNETYTYTLDVQWVKDAA